MLLREGWKVNHKRVYRLYKQKGLMMRPQPRRHVAARRRMLRSSANYPNESWFLSLEDARKKVEECRQDDNKERPHGSLGNLAPVEYQVAQETIS